MSKKPKRLGRPPVKDLRQCLPFRLKGSLVEKCRAKGRAWLEKLITRSP